MKILSGEQKWWRVGKKERRKTVGIKKKYFKSKIPALILCNTFNKGLCV